MITALKVQRPPSLSESEDQTTGAVFVIGVVLDNLASNLIQKIHSPTFHWIALNGFLLEIDQQIILKIDHKKPWCDVSRLD